MRGGGADGGDAEGSRAGGVPVADGCGGGGGGVVGAVGALCGGGGDGGGGVGVGRVHFEGGGLGVFFEVAQVLFEHAEEAFFCEGFGEDVVHSWEGWG